MSPCRRLWRTFCCLHELGARVWGVAQATEGFQVLGEETQLEGLMRVLERRGVREGALFNSLLRHRDSLTAGMPAGPLRCAA